MVVASAYGLAAIILASGIAAALVIVALTWSGTKLPASPRQEEPAEESADELAQRRPS